jgi:ABC-type uncharacterized transport system ATPase subunit
LLRASSSLIGPNGAGNDLLQSGQRPAVPDAGTVMLAAAHRRLPPRAIARMGGGDLQVPATFAPMKVRETPTALLAQDAHRHWAGDRSRARQRDALLERVRMTRRRAGCATLARRRSAGLALRSRARPGCC